MNLIQGGPNPVAANPPDTGAAQRAQEAKDPPVRDVKPAAESKAVSRYSERKAAREEHRGHRVDVEA